MTLYEMTAAANQLYELLISGEIDEQTFTDTLCSMGAGEKLESYCKVIRQLEADAAAYKAEKERLDSKQKTAEKAVKRMKDVISEFMQAQNSIKSSAGVFTVSLRESRAVEIVDESKIPARFLIEQAPKIDKASIRAELMADKAVAGAALMTNVGVLIK